MPTGKTTKLTPHSPTNEVLLRSLSNALLKVWPLLQEQHAFALLRQSLEIATHVLAKNANTNPYHGHAPNPNHGQGPSQFASLNAALSHTNQAPYLYEGLLPTDQCHSSPAYLTSSFKFNLKLKLLRQNVNYQKVYVLRGYK